MNVLLYGIYGNTVGFPPTKTIANTASQKMGGGLLVIRWNLIISIIQN